MEFKNVFGRTSPINESVLVSAGNFPTNQCLPPGSSLNNALHSLYYLSVFLSLRRLNPSRHGMVSPHRLSVTKDWPEYKNIISFVKRKTWFKRQK